jgi:hypothetical protein
MIAKNNKRNTAFQVAHFLAGSCHTPDGAYALLCDLREERQLAIAESAAHALRTRAKIMRARRQMESDDEAMRLDGEADLAEVSAHADVTARNIEAARAELAHIEDCIARVQPHRVHRGLPDPEAHEAAQRAEWMHELIWRAQNSLATCGTIPADQFAAMRRHPDFADIIWPAIEATRAAIAEGRLGAELAGAPALLWDDTAGRP